MDFLVILFIIISIISSIIRNTKKHTKKGPIFDPWSHDADTNNNSEKIIKEKISNMNEKENVLFEKAEPGMIVDDLQEESAFTNNYLIEDNIARYDQIEEGYQNNILMETKKKKKTVEVTGKIEKGLEFILRKNLPSGILISEILGPPRSKRNHFSKNLHNKLK